MLPNNKAGSSSSSMTNKASGMNNTMMTSSGLSSPAVGAGSPLIPLITAGEPEENPGTDFILYYKKGSTVCEKTMQLLQAKIPTLLRKFSFHEITPMLTDIRKYPWFEKRGIQHVPTVWICRTGQPLRDAALHAWIEDQERIEKKRLEEEATAALKGGGTMAAAAQQRQITGGMAQVILDKQQDCLDSLEEVKKSLKVLEASLQTLTAQVRSMPQLNLSNKQQGLYRPRSMTTSPCSSPPSSPPSSHGPIIVNTSTGGRVLKPTEITKERNIVDIKAAQTKRDEQLRTKLERLKKSNGLGLGGDDEEDDMMASEVIVRGGMHSNNSNSYFPDGRSSSFFSH